VGRVLVALSGSTALSFTRPLARVAGFFRDLARQMFGDYRPEQHYMRGPGPACRAKSAKH
jgi:hypothetical protein